MEVMPEQSRNLKDVICCGCNRPIGQRRGALLIQFGMKTLFPKSGKIFCPWEGCGAGNDFKVNRAENGGQIAAKLEAQKA